MKKNISEAVNMTIRLVVALFVILFSATACTEEGFMGGSNDNQDTIPVIIPGDTTIRLDEFKLNEVEWQYSECLAKAEHFYNGKINYLVNNEVVDTKVIEHENAPMNITWEPIAETKAASAEKMYIGSTATDTVFVESYKNQEVNFSKYERECKLSFVGMEVNLTASWYQANLGKSKIEYCRYDSTTVATQMSDTAKVDGINEVIELDGEKYNRVLVTAKAVNHFTDMPANNPHTAEMDIQYSVLVPVNIVPGEKIYEGSISMEGTGSYTKVSETEYKSQIDLTHIFTQDGKQIKEQETVSGTATVKTWVETAGAKMIVPNIQIGNPTVSVNENISNLYKKEGYIYAKKYTTTWTYTWSNGFTKKVFSEVERLYYRREEGKEVAMPYGETNTSFKLFEEGTPSEKSENGKLYNAYEAYIEFAGVHASKAYNLSDEFFLNTTQEFWVEKEAPKDEFLGFDKEIIAGNGNQPAQIIITEHWSISGDKEIVFSQEANYTFSVSEQQRVFGESLAFVSGLSKSTNSGNFNEVSEGLFVRTITDTYTAKFNLCDVKATASYNEAYIEYRGEKINFEFAAATVEYKGLNNPTATEVGADGKLYSRLAYEVSFAHSVLGTKNASVLVDSEISMDPTTPDEWGKLDIEKTKNFGGIAWSWKNVNNKLVPFITGTIVTEYGVVSFWEGGNNFTKMDTNTISDRLSNSIKSEGPEYLIPAYIRILTNPNKHWGYQDINGQYRDEINGVDIELLKDVSIDKPFIAEGGDATVYKINDNRVVITYEGKVLFEEVFAK